MARAWRASGIVQVSGPDYPPNTTPATITKQPVSTSAILGESASFTVGASGPFLLQWLKNGVAIPSATESSITGATESTYRISPVTAADIGAQFSALVYNNVITNTSTVATLESGHQSTCGARCDGVSRHYQNWGDVQQTSGCSQRGTATNYQVNGVAVTAATVRTNVANELTDEKNLVQLTVSTALNADFTVMISGVKDTAGATMGTTNVSGKLLDLQIVDIGSPGSRAGRP